MDNYDLQIDIARQIFLQYDQDLLVRKFHLESDEIWIYLTYLGIPCRINRITGAIDEYIQDHWQECRVYSTVMTIYDLLCYHKGSCVPVLSGQWCTAGTFVVSGLTDSESFTRKIALRFDGHLEPLKAACSQLGGVFQPPLAGADVTCLLPVTVFFPVLLQFWDGDDEFPPKLIILWDKNANQFLHFETTFYLQGDLLDRLLIKANI